MFIKHSFKPHRCEAVFNKHYLFYITWSPLQHSNGGIHWNKICFIKFNGISSELS